MTFDANPDRFFRDLIADCISDVLANQWRERAQRLRDARPRPGDFHGRSSVEERRERWRRLSAMAQACDRKADLIEAAEPVASLPTGTIVPELDGIPLWEAA